MRHWTKGLFVAVAPLLLTSCLWGPGKFASNLTLRKDGSFTLDYRGEIVLQIPSDKGAERKWTDDQARCFVGQKSGAGPVVVTPPSPGKTQSITFPKQRPCTPAEIAAQKRQFDDMTVDMAARSKKQSEAAAKMFGLPGLDDESNRAFAAKMMKYAGWRSVTYRGNGVFDVDYHMVGRATQDFIFPAVPDNDLLLPLSRNFRRRAGALLRNDER